MEQNNQHVNGQVNYQQPPIRNPQPQPIKQPSYPIMKKTKSKFLTFCFALLPGGGQMYHGLMKRGLSLMIIFWGIIALAVLLYIPVIAFILPIVWFYSFFDTINRMNMPIDELKMVKDDFLLDINLPKSQAVSNLFKKRHVWIGWGLTLVGLYAAFNILFNQAFYAYFKDYWSREAMNMVYRIMDMIPALIVPVVCVFIGIKLITANNKKNNRNVYYAPKED